MSFDSANILGNLGNTTSQLATRPLPVTVPSGPTSVFGAGKAFVVGSSVLDAVDTFFEPLRRLQEDLSKMKELDHKRSVAAFESQHGPMPPFLVPTGHDVNATAASLRQAEQNYMIHRLQILNPSSSGADQLRANIDKIVQTAIWQK